MVLLVGLWLTGCNDYVVFQQVEKIDENGWDFKKSVNFSFDAPDTTHAYNLILDVRITPEYAYQNLWLFIETTRPSGEVYIDSINCPMAMADGRWLGSGVGDLIDTPILLRQKFKFSEPGPYVFRIKHGMRNDYLPHIHDIGVILKQIKE